MTGRIVPLEPDAHVAVQSLLPWYATGRLDPEDVALVEAHLPDCEECRAELAAERGWQRVLPVASGAQVDVEAGWAAMRERLGRAGDEPRPHAATPIPLASARAARARPRGWSSAGPLLRWGWALPTALAAALLVMIGVHPGGGFVGAGREVASTGAPASVVALGNDAGAPAYRALAASATNTAAALVRFRADATEAQVRAALRQADARLVDGPTATDGWVVALPRDHYAQGLATLRAQAAVTLAEALEGEGPR